MDKPTTAPTENKKLPKNVPQQLLVTFSGTDNKYISGTYRTLLDLTNDQDEDVTVGVYEFKEAKKFKRTIALT